MLQQRLYSYVFNNQWFVALIFIVEKIDRPLFDDSTDFLSFWMIEIDVLIMHRDEILRGPISVDTIRGVAQIELSDQLATDSATQKS